MANTLYNDYKERLLDPNGTGNGGAAVDMNTDTITISLHTSSYTFSNAHEDFNDLTNQIDSQRETIGSPTVTAGVFDAANTVFTTVAGGSTLDSYVFSKSTGNTANDQLIAYFDTDSGGAISLATNGGDITISHNASGIFAL